MSGSRWERMATAGGAIFAVLFSVGFVMQAAAAAGVEEESRAEIVARYSDGGNELWAEVGTLPIGFGLFFLLLFLASLRATLRAVEGERAVFATAAMAGGILMAALFAVSSAINVAAFSSYDFFEAFQIDPNAVLLLQSLSFYGQGFALVGGGVLVGATSAIALKTRLFPRWLAAAGLVLGAVCLLGVWALFVFVPLPLLVLWVLVISVVLVVRERRALAPGRERAAVGQGEPA